MKYRELMILLPCHGIEDFPQHHDGEAAAGLLAGWTALYHPRLLAAAESAPVMRRSDYPLEDIRHCLIVVPSVGADELPTGFRDRAASEEARVLIGLHDRAAILAQALEPLGDDIPEVDPDLVADFLALGYTFLQTQILTRQMRYSTSLDEVHFNQLIVDAARAAVSGQREEAVNKISACFDLLAEERDHYYAVDAFVIDYTLVSSSVYGEPLRKELGSPTAVNVLLSGETLRAMAKEEPASLQLLRDKLSAGAVGLVGGEDVELPIPLLSLETILGELRRGSAQFEQLLGRRPEVYGRRRFGLSVHLPQILSKLGYIGACHATLDDGRFPEAAQVKVSWEGAGGAVIDALAKVPMNAGSHGTFLTLGNKLGESMDTDHVATLWLAHWPTHGLLWYDDLRRTSRYASAFGRFLTIEEYFRETYVPGHRERFEISKYRSPYLQQAVDQEQRNPLSRFVQYWHARTHVEAAEALTLMLATLHASAPPVDERLVTSIDRSAEPELAQEALDEHDVDVTERAEREWKQRERQFADTLPRADAAQEPGYLVVNPCSFVRRVAVDVSQLERLPDVERPVYAAGQVDQQKHAVVDVPPLGFAWITAGTSRGGRRRESLRLAEDRRQREGLILLRNEFFEAWIDPILGSLKSVKDYENRGTRLSQQLALRWPKKQPPRDLSSDPDEGGVYSIMAADEVDIEAASDVLGQVRVAGRLTNRRGEPVARFVQRFRVWRGSRVLRLDVELEPEVPPQAHPWQSYYASRFAWGDEGADVAVSTQQTRMVTESRRLESPHFVEIASGEQRTTILTGGLPFHRRIGYHMLDTLMIVPGEERRRFTFGIGIDLPQSIHEAVGLMAPLEGVFSRKPPPFPARNGWMYHIDAKNVIATHWSPLYDEQRVVGFRCRLIETRGRATKTRLRCCRPLAWARQVDFLGQSLGNCRLEDGSIRLELAAHEWIELEGRWEAE